MSLRRTLPALGFGLLAIVLVAGCLPWSVEAPSVARFVSRGLQSKWSVALAAAGRTEVVLLPLPRIVFQDVRLTEANESGPVLASGGSLSLQLDLAALLRGRVEIDSLTLAGAEVMLPQQPGDSRWAGSSEHLTHSVAGADGDRPRRIILTRCAVTGRDPRDGQRVTARDVDLTISWPLWSESLALSGGLSWNGTQARFTLSGLRPDALLSGGISPFTAALSWPSGSLDAEGTGSLRDGFKAWGTGRMQTASLRDTLALTGGHIALSPFVEDLTIEGGFEAASGQIQFPTVTVKTGGSVLEGAGSASFGAPRSAIQATLAAESLNLSPLLGEVLRLTESRDGPEIADRRRRSLDLTPLTGGDLDLRISAGSARIGPVQLNDLASSVLVRDGGIEASLGRAGVQGGIVKGRAILEADEDDAALTRVRAQGSFDGIDLGGLLIELGQYRWMLGSTRGSLALEGAGADMGGLLRSVSGRVALASEDGAIAGLDLADVIHRAGAVAPGALARRNGRTPFERATMSLLFADGVGEIVEGSLVSRALTASLTGRITLIDRRFQARAVLLSRLTASAEGGTAPATLFEIGGPWNAVGVRVGSGAEAEMSPSRGSEGSFRRLGSDLPLGIRAYAPAHSAAVP